MLQCFCSSSQTSPPLTIKLRVLKQVAELLCAFVFRLQYGEVKSDDL